MVSHVSIGNPSKMPMAISFCALLAIVSCDADAQANRRSAVPPVAPNAPRTVPPPAARDIIPQASVNPCALPAQAVSAAFGTPFGAGTRLESYGANSSCQYKSTNGRMDVRVKIGWLPAPSSVSEHQNWVKYLAPTMTPVAGDPDNANFQWQADLRTAGLHYFRKNLIIEYRVMTVSSDQNTTKAQLLALRRIP
jgi:hypothetical protein